VSITTLDSRDAAMVMRIAVTVIPRGCPEHHVSGPNADGTR
jgi:hypothetical protein